MGSSVARAGINAAAGLTGTGVREVVVDMADEADVAELAVREGVLAR